MSYVRIWVHCVWGTKRHYPFLNSEVLPLVISHIRSNAKEKAIYIDSLNGHLDHLHCLLSLGPDQSISKVMQLIKGEASHWVNGSSLIKSKFEWADEYFAISVSDSQTDNVRFYIANQEKHHQKQTWAEEADVFIKEYGFIKMEG